MRFNSQAEIDAYFAAKHAELDNEWAPLFGLMRVLIAVTSGVFFGCVLFLAVLVVL